MAQQEEPLYDFPEPSQPSQCKFPGHQRARGSLKSISVLDRLLLTVPVWLQLSINPATALHILQREPPGTFLVRRSRTSQRNVLCVRLADDSVPSFVQQFGIREDGATLCLETSAISFPDLPRLISFYCVSRDVLPFPLELPAAIAKAASHKELESISHMGVEFWSSHLNFRGPREAPKPQKEEKRNPDTVAPAPPAAGPQTGPTGQPDSADLKTAPEPDTSAAAQLQHNLTLLDEFCPIKTRSPKELDCGSGQGALCFINPLFLQSENSLSRRRMFKRSLKVRVSMETSTMLSPPLAPPPPPPLLPKTKRGQAQGPCPAAQNHPTVQDPPPREAQVRPPSTTPHIHPGVQELNQAPVEQGSVGAEAEGRDQAQLPAITEHVADNSDYMQPSPVINLSLSPYLSPSAPPTARPLFPRGSPSLSPHDSPADSPSLSPYQSPSVSPKVSRSPRTTSPSLSPYQSPSPSPRAPFSLSPFTSPSFSQMVEQAYHTPAAPLRADQQRLDTQEGRNDKGNGTRQEVHKVRDEEVEEEEEEEEEEGIVLSMNSARLSDTDSCSSFSSLEGAVETPL